MLKNFRKYIQGIMISHLAFPDPASFKLLCDSHGRPQEGTWGAFACRPFPWEIKILKNHFHLVTASFYC